MSRAFVKEGAHTEAELVPPRAPLPEGAPNWVTPRGWRLLLEERTELAAERERRQAEGANHDAIIERLEDLQARIATAHVITAGRCDGVVRFGATVEVARVGRDAGTAPQRLTIVGVDEADPATGRVAFVSPIARALLGVAVGTEVSLAGRRLRVVSILNEPA
jgi:transcription elongation factor GreB